MSQPEFRNAVVLVIDRIGANMLAAYGSTWFESPNFNRLAARSLVFDQAITQTTDLIAAYDGLWDAAAEKNLIRRIGDAGVRPVLLTDDSSVERLALAEDFERIIPIDSSFGRSIATSADQTELAHFFAQAAQAISELESGSCLWVHSRGLSGNWDAPGSLRNDLADPDDPTPPRFFLPPTRTFDPSVDDPDELLGYQQVCAAQVTLIDDFLGVLLDLLETEAGQSTLLCLASTRGYPLGEHGSVGKPATEAFETCYSESVHVPMMVCLPNQPEFEFARSVRNGSLVQPSWIASLLSDWFGEPDLIERIIESVSNLLPEKKSEFAVTINGEVAAIQTHAWKLIRSPSRMELFAKPDDRCEVNDVSRRCPQIVESLSLILDQLTAKGQVVTPANFELPAELATRLD